MSFNVHNTVEYLITQTEKNDFEIIEAEIIEWILG
jgi:hypothetical protein